MRRQILDEFHLFTKRPKQTLLYNLSDVLQSSGAQIALIGAAAAKPPRQIKWQPTSL
jgi:hypothetical protein